VRLHRRQYRLDIKRACSIAQEAEDVLAIARVIGDPVLLVGHSSGGVVALEALAALPSTFAGAVLYEPPVVIGERIDPSPAPCLAPRRSCCTTKVTVRSIAPRRRCSRHQELRRQGAALTARPPADQRCAAVRDAQPSPAQQRPRTPDGDPASVGQAMG
jgi:pimeloyl-ACP methyl ester carboxylesterase